LLLVFALLSLAACGTNRVDLAPTAAAPTSTPTSAPVEVATSTSPPGTDTPSPTSTPVPEEAALQVVGQIGGQSLAVAVQSSIAYLGVGPRLLTLDVSAPDTPQLLAQSDVLPGVVHDIAVLEGVAYVATGDAGLRLLDVTDPATPREIGSAPAAAAAQVVSLQDRMAYVGESTCDGGDCVGSLRAIDISAPGDPQEVGFLEMPDAVNDVVLVGEYAYVAHRQGLTVVDVSDPAQPLETGAFPLQGSAEDVAIAPAVAGGHAYIVSGPYLLVLDTSSPAAPRQVSSSTILFAPSGVATAGDHVLVSDGFCEFGQCGSHLRTLDVSDLAEPRETGALELGDLVVDVAIADGLAYVVSWESGLSIVDLTDPANPQPLGTFDTPGSIENVALSGEHAFVTGGGENGLLVLDLTDPTAPWSAGALPMLFAGAVALADGYAYVPVWVEGLRVADVRDPANPVEVGALDATVLQGTADRVALGDAPPEGSGSAYAYLTVQEGGLVTLDVTNPADPHPVGAYTPPAGSIRGVAVAAGYAYATGSTSEGDQRKGVLYVIDLADPTRPGPVASVELPDHTSSDVALAGDYAYVTLADCYYFTCSGSLHVIAISDPTRSRLVSSLDVPGGAFAVAVRDDAEGSGRYGTLAAGDEGVWVVDLSDPAQPQLVRRANTPGRAQDIAVMDDLVYVGDGDGGLLIVRVAGGTRGSPELGFDR
jgi:hypothetical protein